jgi:hypothetical protein
MHIKYPKGNSLDETSFQNFPQVRGLHAVKEVQADAFGITSNRDTKKATPTLSTRGFEEKS